MDRKGNAKLREIICDAARNLRLEIASILRHEPPSKKDPPKFLRPHYRHPSPQPFSELSHRNGFPDSFRARSTRPPSDIGTIFPRAKHPWPNSTRDAPPPPKAPIHIYPAGDALGRQQLYSTDHVSAACLQVYKGYTKHAALEPEFAEAAEY